MRYLLIIAHGSRREQANEEIRALASSIADHSANRYDATRHAFLELTQPTIAEAIDDCVAEGANSIVVLPYFLSMGNHVAKDIPEIIQQKRKQYPEMEIELKDYFGRQSEIHDLIVQASN